MPVVAQTMHHAPMSCAGLNWMSDSTRGIRNDKGKTYFDTFVYTSLCTQTSDGRGPAFTPGHREECARSSEEVFGVTAAVFS